MKCLKVLTLIITASALCGCVTDSRDSRVLSVSIEPQRYLLERIAGKDWKVNAVLSKGADPENFDPSMSTLVRTARSKVYFTIGMGGFEESLADRLGDAAPALVFSDASTGVARLYGTHECSGGHHSHDKDGHDGDEHRHGDADPHIWTSIENMKKIAANMAAELCVIDPAGADTYNRNLAELEAELDSLDSRVRVRMEGTDGKAFMVEHPSLSYFAHDYGLEQIALGGEGKELSAAAIRDGIDHGKAEGAKVFFTEPQTGSGRVGQIIKAVASKEVRINTLAYEWPDEIMKIADAIAD